MRGWGVGLTGDLRVAPGNKVRQIVPVNLETGKTQKIDIGPRKFQWLIVSVLQGQLDIWLSAEPDGPIPHLHYFAIGQPAVTWLVNEEETVCIQASGPVTPVQGTVILVG